ncbi:hypothetical protein GCM10019059_38050 [Camelimonas fluminis]|uniref:Ig domain-containing protein n=1 Tax=Camelimonas fluminis TaxID=1576911 RepID=A0ABV7UAV8_9HYPH|nr:putative Ig domain-containing protein [Camelimonas fluminis]GHE74950.1 hypothetical protein GCM10019059_38050 [Camelimonas fluminis]
MTDPARTKPRGTGYRRLVNLFKDKRANVAIIFAIAAPVVIGGIGAGIDYSRASAMRTSLQQSVEATSQAITDKVHTCHDKNRTDNIRTDTGCMNDPAFAASMQAQAQSLLTSNFRQRGFTAAPALTGPVTLDKISGRMAIEATVGYNCLVFQVLLRDCNIVSRSLTNANLSTQADTLQIGGPGGNVRIYVGDASTNLPLTYTVSGGWPPYTFAMSGLPAGLGSNQASGAATARIQGAPSPSDATGCGLPNPCDPLALPASQIIAEDAGDQNRSGLNRQRVQQVVNFTLIRPLRISLSGVMTTQPNMTPSTHYANATRSGGTGAYTYTCTGVPSGMTCNAATGRVSGTPSYWQAGNLTVTVRDQNDGRTASASMPYNFNPPPLNLTFDRPALVGDNTSNTTMAVTASGGIGTLNVSCTGLPAGYSHTSMPAAQMNNGHIAGIWISGSQEEATGSLTCTATDQASQSRSASLGWTMAYLGNVDCLSNSGIKCPGTFKGEFTNCVNGNGRLSCQQKWVYQGGSSDLPESMVEKPNESMGVPSHNNPCTTDGTPLTPIKGCTGTFYGCAAKKGWNRTTGYSVTCLPRAN